MAKTVSKAHQPLLWAESAVSLPETDARPLEIPAKPIPLSVQLKAITEKGIAKLLPELRDCISISANLIPDERLRSRMLNFYSSIDRQVFPEYGPAEALRNIIVYRGVRGFWKGWGNLSTALTEARDLSNACRLLTENKVEDFFERTVKAIKDAIGVNPVGYVQGVEGHKFSDGLYRGDNAANDALHEILGKLIFLTGLNGDSKPAAPGLPNKIQVLGFIYENRRIITDFGEAMVKMKGLIEQEKPPAQAQQGKLGDGTWGRTPFWKR